MGKRLTSWVLSSDSRRAHTYEILRNYYPQDSYASLERRIDNFASSPEDTKKVLLGIYNIGGPDYGYTAIKDFFTKQQIEIIDKAFIANGGSINKERTDAERKRQSGLAEKRGITKDIARSLRAFCYQNTNMRVLANSVLTEKGVTNFGCSRIIDSFEENLDYVEAVIFALYDREGGTDRAYHSLRLFLNSTQIQVTDSLYETMDSQRREARRLSIEPFANQIYEDEPYMLPEKTVSSIAEKARSFAVRHLKNYPEKNFTLVVKDSLFTYRGHDEGYHKANLTLTPDVGRNRVDLFLAIDAIPVKPLSFYNSDLNYTCYPVCQGYYEFEYTRSERTYSFYVEHKKLKGKEIDANKAKLKSLTREELEQFKASFREKNSHFATDCRSQSPVSLSASTLLTGDENAFHLVMEPVSNFLYNMNKFGKQKVSVTLTTINGELEYVEVSLLDKNAIIE